jgi:hypothetical protein
VRELQVGASPEGGRCVADQRIAAKTRFEPEQDGVLMRSASEAKVGLVPHRPLRRSRTHKMLGSLELQDEADGQPWQALERRGAARRPEVRDES